MSRHIDRAPEPAPARRMKIVIPSASRTGTLGLYTAMQMLGFAPYHIKEAMTAGAPHLKLLVESMRAEYDCFSGIRPYSKRDFDKWFAAYDCLIEIPFYMGPEAIEAYVRDPDVSFILTERDPDAWVTSMNRTVGEIVRDVQRPHVRLLRYFDDRLYYFALANELTYMRAARHTRPGMADNRAVMRESYTTYIDMIKAVVPADRMCCIRLEDGLGWEQICPFLGLSPPKEPFPRGNDPEMFYDLVGSWVRSRARHAALKLGLVLVLGASVVVLAARHWSTVSTGI